MVQQIKMQPPAECLFYSPLRQILMGAAAGKDVGDFTSSAGTTRAEDRLAVAEHVIVEFGRRRMSGDRNTLGIWDAQATCTNKSLLAAVDEIVFLKEMQAFPMATAAGRRMDGALRAAMSHLMEELLSLRVWEGSQLEGRRGLCFAIEKLSISMTMTAGVSSPALVFLTDSSTASTVRTNTGEVSFSTIDELCTSGGSQPAGPDDFLDGKFPGELDLICPGSLSVLHDISLRVIRAGYTKELLQTFTIAPCDVLDRFLSILQVGCSLETNEAISYENAEWWTAEDMIRRWILATKLVGKALVAMQMQLYAQSNGAFDRFKDEYLMAIAKRSTFILLRFADGFTSTHSVEKLIYVLEMYEVLGSAVPSLIQVFTGQRKELISRQVEVVLAKLARALKVMVSSLITKIRTGISSGTHTTTRGVGAGIHPLTRYTMAYVESLAPHCGALDLIFKSKSGGTCSAEGIDSFDDLVSELITSLETNLEEISALRGTQGGGMQHLFLANNTSYVLQHAASLLRGDKWVARCQGRVMQHMTDYIEASWAPVVACLEATGTGKPTVKILAKFNSTLEKA
ncbi:exocyst complex component EXO70B2-like [Lolium rigidum]|uniref:exocyst complex component EXO70B2-like n=1 Tax=Lolium rigidum TaxID=89674 RepID=UPI001F5D1B98|nr:exocyst complex component EXO70B2-like [Lolium rigidum]